MPAGRSAVCSYSLDEDGNDLMPSHHEWEWLVTDDVQHIWASFSGGGGIPMGLGSHPDIRVIDGTGRSLARSGGDGHLQVYLERGVDYLASGTWRLVFGSSDAFADYSVQVTVDCIAPEAEEAEDEDAGTTQRRRRRRRRSAGCEASEAKRDPSESPGARPGPPR